jgi:glutamyl-tRNA synthetase
VQERLKFFSEIPELTNFFFEEPQVDLKLIDTNKHLKKRERSELKQLLATTTEALIRISGSDFNAEIIQKTLNQLLKSTDEKPGTLFSIIRIATTWSPASPPLAESIAVLGKERSIGRLSSSIEAL